jgi:Tfp pilus assembly protein PilF
MHKDLRHLVVLALLGLCSAALSKDRPDLGTLAANELMATGRQAVARADWAQALEDLKAAVREDPGHADAHNLLAYAYRKQGKPDLAKAFEHYKMALNLDPQHRCAHEYIGEAYLMAGQPDKAREHLAALERICESRQCDEYQELARAIEGTQRTPSNKY